MNSVSIKPGALPLNVRLGQGLGWESADGFRNHLEREFKHDSAIGVRFSSHAQQRLDSRGLNLSEAELTRLSNGVSSLRDKGVRDGLVVVGDNRFVVSAENRTVITVLSSRDREVFTNIQGVAFE